MRIFVVDDDCSLLAVMESVLFSLGVDDVSTYDVGDDAIAQIAAAPETIDLVILDLNMPRMDGFAFLKALGGVGYRGSLAVVSGEKQALRSTASHIAERLGFHLVGQLLKPARLHEVREVVARARDHMDARDTKVEPDNAGDVQGHRIELFYQPQIDVTQNTVVGAEALMRVRLSDGRIVGPKAFLAQANDMASRTKLTCDLFAILCKDVQRITQAGGTFKFGFNVDAEVFEDGAIAQTFADAVRAYDLNTSMFKIELTETQLPADLPRLLEVMGRMSMAGFALSLDDFGVGSSNYMLLREAPFDELKIDKDIVKAARHDRAAWTFLQSALDIANLMDISFIAEGIEDEAGLTLARRAGVEIVQGFYLARPMSGDDLVGFVPQPLVLRSAVA